MYHIKQHSAYCQHSVSLCCLHTTLISFCSLSSSSEHFILSAVRFKRENPDLSLLDLKFRNMQGFGANMEIFFMKYGSFMQKFVPFETFVKIT